MEEQKETLHNTEDNKLEVEKQDSKNKSRQQEILELFKEKRELESRYTFGKRYSQTFEVLKSFNESFSYVAMTLSVCGLVMSNRLELSKQHIIFLIGLALASLVGNSAVIIQENKENKQTNKDLNHLEDLDNKLEKLIVETYSEPQTGEGKYNTDESNQSIN